MDIQDTIIRVNNMKIDITIDEGILTAVRGVSSK